MDTIFIRELVVDAVIGVHDWERRMPQRLLIDVELACDAAPAAASDQIEDALDYAHIAALVRQTAVAAAPRLLETLAERLAQTIMEDVTTPWVRLVIAKPGAVAGTRGVGVCIERGRRP